MYCLPRYLLMVLAFAGDSTITKAFAIFNFREIPGYVYHTLTKFLPGSCFTKPSISNSKSAAIISEGDVSATFSRRSSKCIEASTCSAWSARRATASNSGPWSCSKDVCPPSAVPPASASIRFRPSSIRCRRDSTGSSATTSFQSCTSRAPCLISRFGPQLSLEVMLPGTANTSRPWSIASLAVMAEPLYCAPSTTSTPTLAPEMMRLRIGKFCGNATAPMGNSETIRPFTASSAASFRFSDGYTDRKSTRLNSSHLVISYAVFCLKNKNLAGAVVTVHVVVTPGRDGARIDSLVSYPMLYGWNCDYAMLSSFSVVLVFFFNDTATTEIYTLSLHDALPI